MYIYIKSFFDKLFALILLILLLPLFAILAIGLFFTGEGYIFYLQSRVGYKNKPFTIIKFATMLKNSPNMPGGYITMDNDPRFTPMGKFLRSTKINELPQLINILKGDMSFVGPRPLLAVSVEAYPAEFRNNIYNVKPGITGIGSIVFRDEQRIVTNIHNQGKDVWEFYNREIFPHKGMLEMWYQKNISFITDVKIILNTAWVIVFPKSQAIYKSFPTLPKRPF